MVTLINHSPIHKYQIELIQAKRYFSTQGSIEYLQFIMQQDKKLFLVRETTQDNLKIWKVYTHLQREW